LTEAHPIETLRDPTTEPHAELVDILRSLSREAQIG
jgi:hypothetical protein